MLNKTTKLRTKTSILVLCTLLQWPITAYRNLADHVKVNQQLGNGQSSKFKDSEGKATCQIHGKYIWVLSWSAFKLSVNTGIEHKTEFFFSHSNANPLVEVADVADPTPRTEPAVRVPPCSKWGSGPK